MVRNRNWRADLRALVRRGGGLYEDAEGSEHGPAAPQGAGAGDGEEVNVAQLLEGPPPTKVAWTLPNVANAVRAHVRSIAPELFAIPGAWVTGSNVWRFLYGGKPDPTSDLDIVCLRTTEDRSVVLAVLDALKLVMVSETRPSGASMDNTGAKYITESGRTVDVWKCPEPESYQEVPEDELTQVTRALRAYPEHSHAQAMAAYSPYLDLLVVIPNPKGDASA